MSDLSKLSGVSPRGMYFNDEGLTISPILLSEIMEQSCNSCHSIHSSYTKDYQQFKDIAGCPPTNKAATQAVDQYFNSAQSENLNSEQRAQLAAWLNNPPSPSTTKNDKQELFTSKVETKPDRPGISQLSGLSLSSENHLAFAPKYSRSKHDQGDWVAFDTATPEQREDAIMQIENALYAWAASNRENTEYAEEAKKLMHELRDKRKTLFLQSLRLSAERTQELAAALDTTKKTKKPSSPIKQAQAQVTVSHNTMLCHNNANNRPEIRNLQELNFRNQLHNGNAHHLAHFVQRDLTKAMRRLTSGAAEHIRIANAPREQLDHLLEFYHAHSGTRLAELHQMSDQEKASDLREFLQSIKTT